MPAGAIQGVADFTTFSLTRPLETVNNFLIEQECPFNARINWACRGTRVVLSNYELGAFFLDSAFTTGAIPAPGSGGETDNDRVNTTGDIASTQFYLRLSPRGRKGHPDQHDRCVRHRRCAFRMRQQVRR